MMDNKSVTMTQDEIILELIKLLKQNNMPQEANHTFCRIAFYLVLSGLFIFKINKGQPLLY